MTPSLSLIASENLSCGLLNLLLHKCMKAKCLALTKKVHSLLITSGVSSPVSYVNSTLVGLYASSGDLKSAKLVFHTTSEPNIFAFNWMISALTFYGDYDDAFGYFSLMQKLGRSYNMFTYSIALKACIGLMDVNKGKEIHGVVYRMYLEDDASVANGLIDMYSKCGSLHYAHKVFDTMLRRDVESWTSMISACCNAGKIERAVELFCRMTLEGVKPNDFTWNVMIACYARRGDRNGAMTVLNGMKDEGLVPDLVTWNALISGFVQCGQVDEALKFFRSMLVSGVKPNPVTVTSLLPGCGSILLKNRGREIHGLIYRMGLDMNVFVASALIDMYSKCGCMKYASNVFDTVTVKNVASWNAMIACYGKHGMVDQALQLLDRMKERKIWPNEVTLVCAISACSHGGLVDKGLQLFRSMKENYGVSAKKEHYACVVDLLCRAGRMTEAYRLVKDMSVDVTDSVLGAFFNGCSIHGSNDLARSMARDVMNMKLKKSGNFTTISNIYAAGGEWEGAEKVREVMWEERIHKTPGYSRV